MERCQRPCLGRTALPAAQASSFLVGSTERWVYGQLQSDGAALFLVDASGTVAGRRGELDAAALRSAFQSILNAFGAELGQRAE